MSDNNTHIKGDLYRRKSAALHALQKAAEAAKEQNQTLRWPLLRFAFQKDYAVPEKFLKESLRTLQMDMGLKVVWE